MTRIVARPIPDAQLGVPDSVDPGDFAPVRRVTDPRDLVPFASPAPRFKIDHGFLSGGFVSNGQITDRLEVLRARDQIAHVAFWLGPAYIAHE